MSKKILIVYANANSIFDQTNGASKSIRLLLESLAYEGCDVTAIMGCTSDTQQGFKTSQEIWLDQQSGKEIRHKTKSFYFKGINLTLVATEHWSRKYLAADEQEEIYRSAENAMQNTKSNYSKKFFIGWGNLLLEESIFKTAQMNNFTTLFYLANPSYLGKIVKTIKTSSKIITDSHATRKLYSNEYGLQKIHVLPKCIEKPKKTRDAEEMWKEKTLLFVNPKLKKGLEALLIIAKCLEKSCPVIRIKIIDVADQLTKELKRLGVTFNELPANISVTGCQPSTDQLFENTTILLLLSLWHESGSRLIHESHLRGIPCLAFNTGGTCELIGDTKEDLFEKPSASGSSNLPRIKNWNPEKMIRRILELSSDMDAYVKHSKLLIQRSNRLLNNNQKATQIILHEI